MSSCPDSLLPTWMISAGLFLLSPYISLLFPRYAWTNITVNPLFFTISSCTDGRSWCFFILLGLFIFIYCFVGKLPPHYYLGWNFPRTQGCIWPSSASSPPHVAHWPLLSPPFVSPSSCCCMSRHLSGLVVLTPNLLLKSLSLLMNSL